MAQHCSPVRRFNFAPVYVVTRSVRAEGEWGCSTLHTIASDPEVTKFRSLTLPHHPSAVTTQILTAFPL